jgi:hypothetical protein
MRIQAPFLKTADSGESGMHIGREKVFQDGSARGVSNEAHFFDGESIFKIQRRYKLKRRDLGKMIEAALVSMRTALRSRGVCAVADVL